jgi:uncharacterized protein with GYD domain
VDSRCARHGHNVEAPDDETLAAALLSSAAQGNIRTTTLRAFNKEQARSIISKTG